MHTMIDGAMKRILLIEDDQTITNLINLLDREGYDVITALNAEAGLELAASRCTDLVLMDIALPGMDGLEATRMLKASDATRRVPVVALTAQVADHLQRTSPRKE